MPTDGENWLTTSSPLSPACLCTALSGPACTLLYLYWDHHLHQVSECRVVIVVIQLKIECLDEKDVASLSFLSTIIPIHRLSGYQVLDYNQQVVTRPHSTRTVPAWDGRPSMGSWACLGDQ